MVTELLVLYFPKVAADWVSSVPAGLRFAWFGQVRSPALSGLGW